MRRESKQKRLKEKGSRRSITSNYLEPDREDASDDENAISLSAIKNKYKKNQGMIYFGPICSLRNFTNLVL